MDELNKLTRASKDAIISLAAEFRFARELADLLKKLKEEQGDVKQSIREVYKMFQVYKRLARVENGTARKEERMEKLLRELLDKLPAGGGEYPLIERMTRQLSVADKHLRKLASYYTGNLGKELRGIEVDEKRLRSLSKKGNHLAEVESLRTRLALEIDQLTADFKDLIKWINSNLALVGIIQRWAKSLERKKKIVRKARSEGIPGPYHWWTSLVRKK